MAVGAGDALYITLPASADLSASQFCGIKIDSNGKAALGDGGAAVPEHVIGILQNKPNAADKPAIILIFGLTKVQASGALATIGTRLSTASDGQVDAAGATDNVIGVQLSVAGAAGDIIEMLFTGSAEYTTAS